MISHDILRGCPNKFIAENMKAHYVCFPSSWLGIDSTRNFRKMTNRFLNPIVLWCLSLLHRLTDMFWMQSMPDFRLSRNQRHDFLRKWIFMRWFLIAFFTDGVVIVNLVGIDPKTLRCDPPPPIMLPTSWRHCLLKWLWFVFVATRRAYFENGWRGTDIKEGIGKCDNISISVLTIDFVVTVFEQPMRSFCWLQSN